jgi:DNA polymerase-3 subunit epsilon
MTLEAAPRFDVVWHAQLNGLLTGSRLHYDQAIVIYNASYDVRMIKQSLQQYGVTPRGLKQPFCAMHLYAEFYGEWDDYRNSYRWHKLGAAAQQCGIPLPADLHRALADAQLTRAIVEYIASREIENARAE